MDGNPLALINLSEAISREQILVILTAVIVPLATFGLVRWWHTREPVQLFFAGYVLGLLLTFWVNVVAKIGIEPSQPGHWREWLSEFVQLPYAWCYLRFVRRYFAIDARESGWRGWFVVMEWLYLLSLLLLVGNALWGWGLSSFVILVVNLANLLGSYVLAMKAWHRRMEGAGAFLAAVVPLALSGLLLAVQWLVEPGGSRINGLLPFWLGVLLHLVTFAVAMDRRERQRAANLQ